MMPPPPTSAKPPRWALSLLSAAALSSLFGLFLVCGGCSSGSAVSRDSAVADRHATPDGVSSHDALVAEDRANLDLDADARTAEGGKADSSADDASINGPDGPVFCPGDGESSSGDITGTLQHLGEPCPDSGALACNGAAQNISLICMGGTWQPLTTCSADQKCDRRQGLCAPVVAACVGRDPGSSFCDGDTQVACGPDLVFVTRTPCCGLCRSGTCQGTFCGDGKVSLGEECDDGNQLAGDGCEPGCKKSSVLQIVGGERHTCVLMKGGLVRCWGANDTGQLGLGVGTDLSSQSPYLNGLVPLEHPATMLAVGRAHTCARLDDGTLRCWGANNAGQLGLGHQRNIGDDEPVTSAGAQVPLDDAAVEVAAGGDETCTLHRDGTVRCWGANDQGQLGLGHTHAIGDDELPSKANTTVSLDAKVLHVAVGGAHVCTILEGHRTRCWGRNTETELGILGTDTIGDNELPTGVPADDWSVWSPLGTISAGRTRTFIWFSDQSGGHGWGDNDDNGLCVPWVGNMPDRLPTQYGGLSFSTPTLSVQTGGYHGCALLQNHQLRCWGINDHGQLGLPFTTTVETTILASNHSVVDFGKDNDGFSLYPRVYGLGVNHSCAALNNGTIKCWGENGSGQLGLGYVSATPDPTYVGGTAATVPSALPDVLVFPSPKP